MLSLDKAHRYNTECDERDAKKARQEEAARNRGGAKGVAKLGTLPGAAHAVKAGVGVSAELAAQLAKRNNRTDLVDGVQKGMANGIRVRKMSTDRRGNQRYHAAI